MSGLPNEQPGADANIAQHRFTHEAMDANFEIIISDMDYEEAGYLAGASFQELDRLHNMLTRFDACSEVGQINLLQPGQSRKTTPEVMECLLSALWVHKATSGAFDITVGGYMDCWRSDKNYIMGQGLSEEKKAFGRARCGIERIVLDPDNLVIGVESKPDSDQGVGVNIDLGGIGKGFALDKIAQFLEEHNAHNALIHGGSSTIFATGRDSSIEEDGWLVGMGEALSKRVDHEPLLLKNQALSRSGTDAKGDHILNPLTGNASSLHSAAWSITPSPTISDALSTAFMVMSFDQVKAFCRSNENVSAYLLVDDRLEYFGPASD